MEKWLTQTRVPLRIFVVWEPILPTDWLRPTATVLSRIPDTRAVQYWDKGHLIAKEIGREISGSQEPSCCQADGTLWDVIVLYPPNTRWGKLPPTFIDGPVVRVAPELHKKLDGNG